MASERRQGSGQGVLWAVVLAGPILWIIDLMVGYAIASVGCATDFGPARLLLHLLTVLCIVGTMAAGAVAWRRWKGSHASEMTVAGGGGGSGAFMALAGILISIFFLLLLIFEDVALFVLQPCGSVT